MSHNDQRPSQLSGRELAQNRLEAWQDDYEWRRRHVDMDRYLTYYEGDAGEDNDGHEIETDDDGFPRINLTQRSIDDSVYFVLKNLPDARLRAARTHLDTGMDPLERDLRLTNIEVTEDTMNSLVDTIMENNMYQDKVERAILDAGIYGIGYIFTEIDRETSILQSDELRELVHKARSGERWTQEDAKRYAQLSQRPALEYYDSRRVTMMAGVRNFESRRMMRCAVLQHFRTESLRQRYSHVEGSENIQSGGPDQWVGSEQDPQIDTVDVDTTSHLTTWEIEPYRDTISIPNSDRTASFLNARLVKTVVAGDVLVEKRTWDAEDRPISLPIVPFQFRQSRRHPYGRSEAKSLMQSEKLVNKVRSMMYKSGLNSVRPDGISVFVQNLAPGDQEELERSFEEGGPAFITGNMVGNEVSDIREIVMPHTFASSPLDPALRQMMNMEMEAFRFNSAKGSEQAVDQARTGRGKRAQIAFNDRPKNFSVMHITGSIKRLFENTYELIQFVFGEMENVPADIGELSGKRRVKLNQKMRLQNMPVLQEDGTKRTDPALRSDENPDGMVTQDLEFVLNSTNFDMDARVENRAELPFDIPSRHRIVRQLESDRYLSHEFARRLILSDEMRLRDDMHRRDEQRKRRRITKAMRRQARGSAEPQVPENPPSPEGAPTNQEDESEEGEPAGQSQATLPEDVREDIRQQVAQNTNG